MPPDTPDDDLTFGNEVYRVRFDPAQKVSRPTYGHRYWFFLTDAVEDVPEYIVRWDNFVKSVSPLISSQKKRKVSYFRSVS